MDAKKVKREIQSITNQLVKKYKAEKVILFGSAAKGKFGPDSDLDFLIVKSKVPKYGYQRMGEVRALIEKNIATDFLVYRTDEFEDLVASGEPFLNSILDEGKTLYG